MRLLVRSESVWHANATATATVSLQHVAVWRSGVWLCRTTTKLLSAAAATSATAKKSFLLNELPSAKLE
jgi:hypothetical protein